MRLKDKKSNESDIYQRKKIMSNTKYGDINMKQDIKIIKSEKSDRELVKYSQTKHLPTMPLSMTFPKVILHGITAILNRLVWLSHSSQQAGQERGKERGSHTHGHHHQNRKCCHRG